MIRSAVGIALCVLAIPLAAQQPPAPGAVLMSPAKWREDLRFVAGTMRDVHPSPYHAVPRERIEAEVAALDRDIPRLDDRRVALRMASIVAMLGDGHSALVLGAPMFGLDRAFPIRFERFPDGVRVVAARPADTALLGARVVRIGGLPAAAAWDSAATIASGDNLFSRWAGVPRLLAMPDVMAALGLASADSLSLDVEGPSDATSHVVVPAAPRTPTSNGHALFGGGWRGAAGADRSLAPGGDAAPLPERHRDEMYWYVVRGDTLYAQVNGIGNSGDTVHLGTTRGVVSFGGFADRVLARLDSGGIARMVLDLRYNDGGNNTLVRGFVAGLAARPSINQRGRLFVITGRATYSAAMNFTSLLEDRTAAIFVGEPPGGSPRHYGDAMTFTLPNSRLPLRISTLRWEIGVQPTDVRRVMEPELPAPPSAAALRAGRDAPLDAIAGYADGASLADRLVARFREARLAGVASLYEEVQRAAPPAPWRSDVQQLLKFAYAVIPLARDRAELFGVFRWVCERAPESPEAWFADGRVHAFVRDWGPAAASFARARALRPTDDLLRRMEESARRQR